MSTGQVDNPALSSSFQAQMREVQADQTEHASLASRLMQRAHQSTFTVQIDAGLEIEMYVPTDGEYMQLVRLQNDMLKVGTEIERTGISSIDAASNAIDSLTSGWDRLHELIAALCVDPSLDFEFFRSGMISSNDKNKIVSGIIENVQGSVKKVEKFRKK